MALDALRGVAQGIAGRALRRVSGNLRSGLLGTNKGGSDKSDFPAVNNFRGKYTTEHMTFPMDVTSGRELGNHGHYMIFEINEQKPPGLKFNEPRKKVGDALSNIEKSKAQQGSVPTENVISGLDAGLQAAVEQKAKNEKRKREQEQADYEKSLADKELTVGVERRETNTMKAHIALYMPPTVTVSHTANYTDQEIGVGANLAMQAYQDVQAQGLSFSVIGNTLQKLAPEFEDEALRKLVGAAGIIPGMEGLQHIVDVQQGFVKTPHLELSFKGITKRTFQYQFTMMPKSEAEAEMVSRIVKTFKRHMLPKMAMTDVRRLTIPDTFSIKYMFDNAENPHLHKISECVLETVSVSYGGDRYKTYEGGRPVVTSLTLNFKELDLITKEKIDQGY